MTCHENSLTDRPPGLPAEAVAAYGRDGILFPLPGIGGQRALELRRTLEKFGAGSSPLRLCHLWFGWAFDLVLDPVLLDYAEGLLGPDVIAWGSIVFRKVTPGDYKVVGSDLVPPEVHQPIHVMGIPDSQPAQNFYDGQTLVKGFNYITTRDGTKLSAYITFPGPPENGPYPTVVNYSGYNPSQPGAPISGVAPSPYQDLYPETGSLETIPPSRCCHN